MTVALKAKTNNLVRTVESFRVVLDDGHETTVHVAKYPAGKVLPRVVLFDEETNLLDWCENNDVQDAVSGGFFLRGEGKPLGEKWIKGKQQETVPFASPWSYSRGAVYISPVGGISVAPRYLLPQQPVSDLLQAGPLLVQEGKPVVVDGEDAEGFSAAAHQFDTDITDGRYPRSAIGVNNDTIFAIACDGRDRNEAGLTFGEFAEVLAELGISEALNLDGGSSSTLIAGGELQNHPRSDDMLFERGRPIYSAIVFEKA
jgi:uncharacterized protein YigE (DUF2233 family)